MSGINPEFLPREKSYDVQRAKKLLAEAGHPNGLNLPAIVFCASFPEEPRMMAIVAQSLKQAGINLELREIPTDGFDAYTKQVNPPIGRPARSLGPPAGP